MSLFWSQNDSQSHPAASEMRIIRTSSFCKAPTGTVSYFVTKTVTFNWFYMGGGDTCASGVLRDVYLCPSSNVGSFAVVHAEQTVEKVLRAKSAKFLPLFSQVIKKRCYMAIYRCQILGGQGFAQNLSTFFYP